MANKYQQSEISALGENLARCHFNIIGEEKYPIEPEIIASKMFGLDIFPQKQLHTVRVRSGIDTSQSVIFIDYDIYMSDDLQYLARQSIAHELGHIIFDAPLLRQLAATTVDDAFELHEMIVNGNSGIEWTAHKLSGTFLAPRDAMLKRVATMILRGYDLVVESYPNMTLGEVFGQLQSSQLTRYFGVSEDVIRWRFKDEEFHRDFKATPQTPLSHINKKIISTIAGAEYLPIPLSERIKSLLPEELLLSIQKISNS
jgi:Zn-dependent peptidase ImmA (M78 family)